MKHSGNARDSSEHTDGNIDQNNHSETVFNWLEQGDVSYVVCFQERASSPQHEENSNTDLPYEKTIFLGDIEEYISAMETQSENKQKSIRVVFCCSGNIQQGSSIAIKNKIAICVLCYKDLFDVHVCLREKRMPKLQPLQETFLLGFLDGNKRADSPCGHKKGNEMRIYRDKNNHGWCLQQKGPPDNLSARTKETRAEDMRKAIYRWDFNAWLYGEDDQVFLAAEIFLQLGVLEECGVSEKQLFLFLGDVFERYVPNPFHSFMHAVDTLQVFFYVLHTHREISSVFDSKEVLTVATAILCHDLGHPGPRRVSAFTEGGVPLEKYHAALFREISIGANGIARGSGIELECFNQKVEYLIMQTQLSKYPEYTQELRERGEALGRERLGERAADKLFTMANVVRFCDIGNVFRPARVGRLWKAAFAVESEVFDTSFSLTQNFIAKIVLPFYTSLSQVFPCLGVYSSFLERNRQ
ncbi:MAG: cGMP-specific phosphodiesterase [Amphiamblys sp. WSBS2006]|nr:MAG: cGMP-specific phosphodiesterase [Amphiamblys sp. WSBS2006]OIR57643.1 MAG: cGMP-specific phosphodiesterase [Amphiamblys sp. WSBS2006]